MRAKTAFLSFLVAATSLFASGQLACIALTGVSGFEVDPSLDNVTTCDGGLVCGGKCVNTSTDRDNCGACGTRCGAGQSCTVSKCVDGCAASEIRCGDKCFDPNVTAAHCGNCATVCTDQDCVAGKCVPPCIAPTTRCGADCVDFSKDAMNCGACGKACATGSTCELSVCTFTFTVSSPSAIQSWTAPASAS